MQNGNIKRVIPQRGFGFLTDDKGTDRFFHLTNLTGEWDELPPQGTPVRFTPQERESGPAAANVTVLSQDGTPRHAHTPDPGPSVMPSREGIEWMIFLLGFVTGAVVAGVIAWLV